MFDGQWSGIPGFGRPRQETEDRKSKGKSPFKPQKIVENGLVRNVRSVSLSASEGRVWIGSSVKSCSRIVGRMSVVAFERGSSFEGILDSVFRDSELQSIVVPSSVVVFGKWSFCGGKSLESVIFESYSRLERIEEFAFAWTGLETIKLPCSVVVLGKRSFYGCKSLGSVRFENGSRLERIEESAFCESGLELFEIPGRVAFIHATAFAGISLDSIWVSPDNMRFHLRGYFLEDFDGSTTDRYFGCCRSIVIPSSGVVLGKGSFCGCESL
jgi:hypothetical protein